MRSLFLPAFIFGFGLFMILLPAQAQSERQIELHKGFFKPLKYSQGTDSREKVYNFSGLKYQAGFQDLLGEHPSALEAANKARPYNAVALVGSVTMLVGSAWILSETINEAKAVSDGDLFSDPNYTSGLGLVVAGGLAAIVGGRLGSKHLKNGISIFNDSERSSAARIEDSSLRLSIAPDVVARRPGVRLKITIG